MRSRPGFTTAEIIVVMVLMVILGAMSMSKLSNLESGSDLNRVPKAIQTDLQNAFALSARLRAPVRIYVDTTKMAINITDRAESTYYRREAFGVSAGFGLRSSNVQYYPSTYVEIYPNGYASDTFSITFTRTLGGNTMTRHVWMGKAGLVTVK